MPLSLPMLLLLLLLLSIVLADYRLAIRSLSFCLSFILLFKITRQLSFSTRINGSEYALIALDQHESDLILVRFCFCASFSLAVMVCRGECVFVFAARWWRL